MVLPTDFSSPNKHLEEMKALQSTFPFGQSLSAKILAMCQRDMYGRLIRYLPRQATAKLSKQKKREIFDAYRKFMLWAQWDVLFWLRCHEALRTDMIRLLRSHQAPRGLRRSENAQGLLSAQVMMDNLNEWVNEVIDCVEWVKANKSRSLKLSKREIDQVCVDVLHEVSRHADVSQNVLTRCRESQNKLFKSSNIQPSSVVLTFEDIQMEQQVGYGASGKVYRARFGSRKVAVKEFTLRLNAHKVFSQEASIFQSLNHRNVVPFVGIVVALDLGKLWIISEFMAGGPIHVYLRDNPDASRLGMLANVVDGLDFLHRRGIVHGDLKGDNILADSSGRAMLADFGLSSYADYPSNDAAQSDMTPVKGKKRHPVLSRSSTSHCSFSGQGSKRWMSPERHDPERFGSDCARPTIQSDVFSLGMVVYEIFSGQIPYQDLTTEMAVLRIISGIRPPQPHLITRKIKALWAFASRCLLENPAQRPAVDKAQHLIAFLINK